MKWRASAGLAKLRQRLAKRGVALGGVALASLLTSEASAAVPETLLPSILAAVKTAVATTATATGATTTAGMLAKGAMKAMFIAKVKLVAAIAAAVIVTGTAVPVGIAVAQAVSKDEAPKTNTASVVDDSTAMYLRAVEQMRAKDYKAAIQTLESFLQTYPDAKTIRPEALYWLGDCYSKAGDPAAAIRVLEKANSEFPESKWGKYARGQLSADNGFITLSPRPDYEVSLTDADFKKLDAFEATILGKADKHFAKKEPHEYELAADAYNSFVVKYPKSKAVPYALVRKGRSLQFVGKRNQAIRVYREVLDYFPDSNANAVPALLYLAQCHYLNKNAKEATKAIAQLRANYGKHEAAACGTFLLAQMQADGGKIDEALATLGTIAAPFPAYAALAQLRQAEVYEKAGKTAEAISAYRATMTKYPGTPESDLAHSALEKMGSRSPDATQLAP
jgi:TolA-binding protein